MFTPAQTSAATGIPATTRRNGDLRKPLALLYVHLIWGTKDARPVLVGDVQERVYLAVETECRHRKIVKVALGGVADHIHLLARIPATLSVAALIKHVMEATAEIADEDGGAIEWEPAYAAYSVCSDDLPMVTLYIERQEQHHASLTVFRHFELRTDDV